MSHVRRIGRGLLIVGTLMLLAAPALAQNRGRGNGNGWGFGRGNGNGNGPPAARSAPEIDPASAGAALSLLVGGTLLIGARRSRRSTAQ